MDSARRDQLHWFGSELRTELRLAKFAAKDNPADREELAAYADQAIAAFCATESLVSLVLTEEQNTAYLAATFNRFLRAAGSWFALVEADRVALAYVQAVHGRQGIEGNVGRNLSYCDELAELVASLLEAFGEVSTDDDGQQDVGIDPTEATEDADVFRVTVLAVFNEWLTGATFAEQRQLSLDDGSTDDALPLIDSMAMFIAMMERVVWLGEQFEANGIDVSEPAQRHRDSILWELQNAPGFLELEALCHAQGAALTVGWVKQQRGVLITAGATPRHVDNLTILAFRDELRELRAEAKPAPPSIVIPATIEIPENPTIRWLLAQRDPLERVNHGVFAQSSDGYFFRSLSSMAPGGERLGTLAAAEKEGQLLSRDWLTMKVAQLALHLRTKGVDVAAMTLEAFGDAIQALQAKPALTAEANDPPAAGSAPAEPQRKEAEIIATLQPAVQIVWASWCEAEKHFDKTPTARQAWDWIRESELPEPQEFGTWDRHLRSARKALGRQKNTPRGGREGRSVVKANQL